MEITFCVCMYSRSVSPAKVEQRWEGARVEHHPCNAADTFIRLQHQSLKSRVWQEHYYGTVEDVVTGMKVPFDECPTEALKRV